VVTLRIDFDLCFQHPIADVQTISFVPTHPDIDQEAEPIEQVERVGLDGQRAAIGRQQLEQVVSNGLDRGANKTDQHVTQLPVWRTNDVNCLLGATGSQQSQAYEPQRQMQRPCRLFWPPVVQRSELYPDVEAPEPARGGAAARERS
jgi:hypothetical protein